MYFLFVKINTQNANRAHFDSEQLFLKQLKFYEVQSTTWDTNQRTLDCMPRTFCTLTDELRECDTSQFMGWDTGSGDIDIFVCKDYQAGNSTHFDCQYLLLK